MSRVLIVEDEARLAEGLRFNLTAEGHEVDLAGDGETAIERLLKSKEHFDAGCARRDVAGNGWLCCGQRRCGRRKTMFPF